MNYSERNKLLDKISVIGLTLIGVELLIYAIDYCYTKRIDVAPNMPIILNILGVIFLTIAIGVLIYSFKKEKHDYIICGIELLVIAFICPFMTYWYYPKAFGLTTNWFHTISHHVLMIVVFVYYIGRAIYVTVKSYKNSNSRRLKKKKV